MKPSFVDGKPMCDEKLWFKYREEGETEEQVVLKISATMVEAMAQFIIHVHKEGFAKQANGDGNPGNEQADGAFGGGRVSEGEMESKMKKRKMDAGALAQMFSKSGEESGDNGGGTYDKINDGDVDEGDGGDVNIEKLMMSTLIRNVNDRRPIEQKWLANVIQNDTHVEGSLMLYGAFTANRDKTTGNVQAGAAAMKMIDALDARECTGCCCYVYVRVCVCMCACMCARLCSCMCVPWHLCINSLCSQPCFGKGSHLNAQTHTDTHTHT
jgi:hypothetical protein